MAAADELTDLQRCALNMLENGGPMSERAFGKLLWPGRRGASPRVYLMHLQRKGLVEQRADGWAITADGAAQVA